MEPVVGEEARHRPAVVRDVPERLRQADLLERGEAAQDRRRRIGQTGSACQLVDALEAQATGMIEFSTWSSEPRS